MTRQERQRYEHLRQGHRKEEWNSGGQANHMTQEKRASVKNGVGRMVLTALVLFLSVWFIVTVFDVLNHKVTWVQTIGQALMLILVLGIYSQHRTASMKMPWIMLMLAFPIVGVILYLVVGLNGATWKMRRRYEEIDKILLPILQEGRYGQWAEKALKDFREKHRHRAGIATYLYAENIGYPMYENTDIIYYAEAVDGFQVQKEALKQAKHFIFMEYHAIEDAEAWGEIEEILIERVKAGVEVRVFYDDMGSIWFINRDFIQKLEGYGIKCRAFNPVLPGLNFFLNNRDHRKITVIDGKIGFTGGYNLANEYFNYTHPYGQWKDTGIKLTGQAVRSLTITFLENWNAVRDGDEDDLDCREYLPTFLYEPDEKGAFVQPYADSPMDNEQVGENVYISILDKATDYCWFVTPYLIITDEMMHAMDLAAKRGVDVRVITPGIPDKKIIYSVTRSYYNSLVREGVRIYEWTPGFCHCKMSISDDIIATCGTINLDYRSLYHHFENGCIYANCQAVLDTRRDFEQMFTQSKEVTEYYRNGQGRFMRIWQMVLRLFAPLL